MRQGAGRRVVDAALARGLRKIAMTGMFKG